MAMDVSTLVVKVESKGIDNTTKSLDNLTKSAETAEKYVQNLMDRMGKSSHAVNAVVSSMNQLRAAMNGAIPTNTISAATAEFKKMSDELRKITDAMGKGVGKGVTVNIHEIGTSSKEAVKGVESLNQSLAKGQNVFQAFGKELYHIRNLLGGTMLAAAMGNMAGEAIRMADAWTLMGAKLKIQLGSTVAAGMAQEQLFQTAQKLRVPMNDMITLYSRLIPAMSEYGYTTKDAMSITTAMGAALKVSGATGAEAASVMLQFSQAMQAGRLNGAEFNAIAEGAPIILRLIGKEINKTRGELKAMGAEGTLSVEVITEALKKNEAELVKISKTVPDTVESAFVNLKNSMTKYIGEVNNATGVTGLLASMVKGLASNLETVGAVFKYTLIAGIVGYTSTLIAHNVAAVQAVALNAALARSLGITAGAATTAAGATGLFATALNFIARHPVIIALTAITTGLAYLYDNYKQTSEAGKEFTNQLAEIDKLSGSQAASAYNMLMEDRLDKMTQENNKLTELLERRKKAYKITDIIPLNAAIDRQRKAVADLAEQYRIAAIHKNDFVSGETVTRVNAEVAALQKENKWLEEQVWIGKKLTDVDQKIWETKQEIKKASEGAHKESLKQVLTELEHKKALGEWLDNIGKKTKKAQSDIETFDKKYMKMVESIKLFIANQEEELGLRRKLTAAEKEAVKIEEFIANNRSKMTNAEVVAMTATKQRILLLGEQQIAQEKINKDLDEYYERIVQIGDEESKKSSDYFKVKEDSLQKTRVLLAEVNGVELSSLSNAMAASEADKRKIKQLNDQISKVWELAEAKAESAYFDAEMSGDTAGADRAAKALKAIQDRIKGIRDQIKLTEMENVELDKQLDLMFKISQIKMSEIGRTPGAILADGFGEAGKAIGGMVDAYDDFGKQAKQINAELQAQLEYLAKKGASPEVIAKAEQAAAEKRVQINTQMYGNMASSAKGFFKQQTTEYKTLERVEKAFRALEMAMAIKSMVTQVMGIETVAAAETASVPTVVAAQQVKGNAAAATGVANQAAGDPYTAIPRMAAMVAIMAALGFVVSNINGGVVDPTEERQANQGTGTVLGDVTAKSESITNAIELIEENTSVSAKYNEGMLLALKNIETALGGAAKMITRSNIGTGGDVNSYGGIDLGIMSQNSYMGKVTTNFIDKLADIDASLKKYLLPMLGGDALKKLFGVKVSVKDTGIFAQPQTVSDIHEKGFSGASFTTVEKKARFRKAKQEDVFGELPEDVEKQFELVIKSLSSGLQEVSGVLDVNGEDFNNRLNNFVVDIGRISLEGLSGEEVQKQLTTVFSKLGDEMALAAIPGLDSYQEVGEGYLETLIRVASTVATVDGIFNSIGQTMQLTGTSSIDAKFGLVELAGGLQELSGLLSNFYDKFYTEAEKEANATRLVTEEFNKLGITMLDLKSSDARIKFRDLVNSFKDTNQGTYVSLLNLVDAVDSLTPAFEGAAAAASDSLGQKLALENRIQELTMSSVEYTAMMRQKELLALDSSLRPLQERIWALEDENKASQEALELSKKRQDIELKILSLTDPIAYTVALRQKELASLDESLKPLQERVWALEDEKAAINLQITAQESLIDSITQSLNTVDDLIGSVNSLSEAGRGLVGLSPQTKTLVESFNDTEAQINSLSETLNTFSGTAALSATESLAALIEQGKGMSDFQNSLTDSIASLRFESMSLEDRLSSLRAKERKLFNEITSSKDPLTVAKNLQDTINARYSLEKEYQDSLISGQQEISNVSKDTIKQQIDALKNTRDLLGEIRSFTYDLRIGDSSVLSPQQQLEVASQQFYEVLAKANAGDTKAQSSITSVAKTFLDEAKGYYASTTGYVNIFNQVMGALSGFGATEVIDPQLVMLEKQLTALDSLNISTIDLRERQALDLEKVGTTLSGLQAENRAKQEELVQSLKDQIAELKAVQANQVAQIKQQLAIRDETNALLNDAKTKLTDMRDSLKLLERK